SQREDRLPLRRGRCESYTQIRDRTDRARASMGPLLQATRTVPIVFVTLLDPVGAGFVDSLARPGGNATGFIAFEYGLSGKWLELLKQIAPSLTRVAILRDPGTAAGIGQVAAIQSVAPSFAVELRPIDMREVGENRARCHDVRAPFEWRFNRDVGLGFGNSWRSDHHTCRSAQTACGLRRPSLRHWRRPDLL